MDDRATASPRTPLASSILSALERGVTVLTPNQRAARTLQRAFDQTMRGRGQIRWSPPAIFALDTWLATLWHRMLVEGAATHLLLNRTQEQALWRAILAADREISSLHSPDALAEMAAGAWHLLCEHNGRGRLNESAVSADTRSFARWAGQFDRLCARELYLTRAQLPAALEQALAEGKVPLPGVGLMLVDFDAPSPATVSLLASIERAGYPVESVTTAVPAPAAHLFSASDEPAELRAAARWSRDLLALEPETHIAIVVPNLADRRATLERVFSATLAPSLFEFSLGRPLTETSLANTAVTLLRWTLEPLNFDGISTLLLSPHFGSPTNDEHAAAAAEFDVLDLRQARTLRPELSIPDTIELVGHAKRRPRLGLLHGRLRDLHRAAAAQNLTPHSTILQPHAAWADAFRTVLDAAQWSRATPEDSITFQARRRWESALDELATLDFNGTRLTAAEALQALTRIAGATIFAPQSTDAPIQILGPLELGGTPFDALWFLGADDRTWPVNSASHPLLSWQLQRALATPGADRIRADFIAQTLTHRITHSADRIVVSFAQRTEDGPNRPSPLIQSLALPPLEDLAPEAPHAPLAAEILPDTQPLPPLPPTTLRGGANVLALQAACGFRAFAERRLSSTAPDSPEPGLAPRESGNLVHKVMQAFWDHLRTQGALRDLTPASRDAFLDECIDRALTQIQDRSQHQVRNPWDTAFLAAQRTRLHQLLSPWLETELDRPTFTVLATEQQASAVRIGPLALDLRVDRIDGTAAGNLILDYKTGSAATTEWLSDRPDAPQLPLYAVLADPESLGGVAFALLRAGDDLNLKGYADTDAVFGEPSKMPVPTLQMQLEDWHRILESLATAFAEGDAAVVPKLYPKTCKHCDQRILCRLNPSTLPEFGEEEDEFPGTDPATLSYAGSPNV